MPIASLGLITFRNLRVDVLGTRELWFRVGAAPEEHLIVYVLGAVLALLGLTEMSYRLIERPARRNGYRLAARYRARRLG